jgi:MFS family permease
LSNGHDQQDGAAASAKHPAFLAVFPSIMLPMFLAVVDQTIVATALPAIAAATGDVGRASWVVVAYLIASTIAAPIYGRLGDALGRKRAMHVALAVFIVASLLCAASPSLLMLTLARVLQGLGGGGLMTLSQAMVGESIPPRERARYQGYLAAVAVCASTFGPVAGGYLTEHFGWQSIFLVNVPIGLGAVALTKRRHRRPAGGRNGGPTRAGSSISRCSSRPCCLRSSNCSTLTARNCRPEARSSCWASSLSRS